LKATISRSSDCQSCSCLRAFVRAKYSRHEAGPLFALTPNRTSVITIRLGAKEHPNVVHPAAPAPFTRDLIV
jgi:hypothetical protein